MKSLMRGLHCKHCKDVVAHRVYFIRRYQSYKKVEDGHTEEETRVAYEQYCDTCKSFEEHDVADDEWVTLLKNKTWEAK